MSQQAIPATLEEAKPFIRARIWGMLEFGMKVEQAKRFGTEATLPNVNQFMSNLLMGHHMELDWGIVTITPSIIERWGGDLQGIVMAAAMNDRANADVACAMPGDGVYVVNDANRVASILIDSRQLTMPVKGAPIVVPAARDELVVFGQDDPAAVALGARLTAQIMQHADAPLPPFPFIAQPDGTWGELDWPDTDEVMGPLSRAFQLFWSHWSNVQAAVIDGGTAYVAQAQVHEREHDIIVVAPWQRGVETLLPTADAVSVVSETGDVQLMRFDEFINRPGVTQTELNPPRFHIAPTVQV